MLSGGEQQRAGLVVALVHDPAVVLADEPTAEIDAEGADQVVKALRAACTEFGSTVVMATHDLGFAIQRATHALLLNERAIAFGPPREALRSETLAAAYGDRLILLADGAGPVLDEGAHHHHGTEPAEARLPGEIPGGS